MLEKCDFARYELSSQSTKLLIMAIEKKPLKFTQEFRAAEDEENKGHFTQEK